MSLHGTGGRGILAVHDCPRAALVGVSILSTKSFVLLPEAFRALAA